MNDETQILFWLFMPIGIILLLVGIIWLMKRSQKKKRCSYKTTAVIVGANKYRSTDLHYMKSGIYEYQYQGNTYYKKSNVSSNSTPKIGKTVSIFLNPNDPEDCIVEDWVGILAISLFMGFGIIFLFLATLFAIII